MKITFFDLSFCNIEKHHCSITDFCSPNHSMRNVLRTVLGVAPFFILISISMSKALSAGPFIMKGRIFKAVTQLHNNIYQQLYLVCVDNRSNFIKILLTSYGVLKWRVKLEKYARNVVPSRFIYNHFDCPFVPVITFSTGQPIYISM